MTTDAPPDITADGTRRRPLERAENIVKVGIVGAVAAAGLAASFTHMHDWTMRHMPAGTPSWFGWANAVISELIPIAALLTIRRRLATGEPYTYPGFLLLTGAALSLTAQLAAVGSAASWSARFLAVLPALAFMGLSKMVLSDLDGAARFTARVAAEEAARAEALRDLRRQVAAATARATQVEAAAASTEAALRADLDASTTRLRELEEALRGASAKTTAKPSVRSAKRATEAAPKAPRKTGAELLQERVEAAKELLPMWQLETPSGPEVGSALGIKSEGVISDIRKQLTADRLALPAATSSKEPL